MQVFLSLISGEREGVGGGGVGWGGGLWGGEMLTQ